MNSKDVLIVAVIVIAVLKLVAASPELQSFVYGTQ